MRLSAILLMLGSLPLSLCAAPQGTTSKEAKAAVAQQLLSQYVLTRFAGPSVKQPGSILLVQKDGIGAVPGSGAAILSASFGSNYKDGRVRHDKMSELVQGRLEGLRNLSIGERVYLVKVQVTDSSVIFDVQSCGACDPRAIEPYPMRSTVAFPFGKGFLENTTTQQMRRTVEEVFVLAGAGAADPPPVQPVEAVPETVPNTPQPAIPPVTETPKEPATIELGQSVEQVQTILGQPDTVVDLGSKKIFVYKSLKVTFIDGRVSDVQ